MTSYDTFSNTIAGLAQGLHVRHIATFDVSTCAPEEMAANVFARYPDFDQIPVEEGGHIIGVLERGKHDNQVNASESMRRLDDGILVAAEQPISEFLPLMANPPYYRLVLDGSQINGIVTRSDLIKLPVRLLAFSLVISMETLMKEVIDRKLSDERDWLKYLSEGRQTKTRERQADFKENRLDLPLLELTDYCDKYTILAKHFHLQNSFKSDQVKIERLRHAIAHGRSYAEDDDDLVNFIYSLERALFWIEYLNIHFLNEDIPA